MDYSDDDCLSNFTPDQITRMLTSYADTRLGYMPGNGSETIDPNGNGPQGE